MPAPAWSRGPDLTVANGVIYGPYEYRGYAVTDEDSSVYFLPGNGAVNAFIRLDSPYDTWFQMWGDPWQAMTEFGGVFAQGDQMVLVPQAGAGGARYDKSTPDLGDAANDGSSGPWETTAGAYNAAPGSFSTWESMLAGQYEANISYFATCEDSSGRRYLIGPRRSSGFALTYGPPRDTILLAADYSGYLDPDAVHAIRIADIPASGGDIDIEGHAACCDSSGRVLVAGGLNTSGPMDAFRRYDPGPAVGAGVVEIQRVRLLGGAAPLGTDSYRVGNPRDAFSASTSVIQRQSNQATVQAAYNAYFGAGVVTIAGTGADHTVTRIAAGAQPRLAVAVGFESFNDPDTYTEITVTQRGTGGPSVDTWTELDVLPVALYSGVLISDGLSPEGIHYIGPHDGTDPIPSHYRWREGEGWTQFSDLPDGLTATSIVATVGEAQPGFLRDGTIIIFAYSPDSTQSAIVSFDLANQRWGVPIYTEVNHQRGGFALTDSHAVIMGGADETDTPTSAVERIRIADLAAFGGLHLAELSWRSQA